MFVSLLLLSMERRIKWLTLLCTNVRIISTTFCWFHRTGFECCSKQSNSYYYFIFLPMPRTYKKRKPKTGLEQYTASSPWKRRLIWLYYLGHLTKDGAKQGLSCKIKEEKGDPTIGGVEQYKASGNIKTYCSQTSFYDQGKVSVQISSRPSLVFSLSSCSLS